MKEHNYQAMVKWTGNRGNGTSGYREYERSHTIRIEGKPEIEASSDPAFRGDPARHNPEELFLASLSSCHMLWFLHVCSTEGITVTEYIDFAEGIMIENKNGSGQFKQVTLKPKVTILEERMAHKVPSLHTQANKMCFIANSCNFPVRHEPETKVSVTNR